MKNSLVALVTLAYIASGNIIKPTFLTNEFINSLNQKHSTWIAGRNFPEDTTFEELRRLNGAIERAVNITKSRPRTLVTEEIPDYFDAREQWPDCQSIREIRNQGSCGSCWAFSTVAAISDRYCIATRGRYIQVSPEELITCCERCGSGCQGGISSIAWDYWIKDGIVSGGDFKSNQGCQPYAEEAFMNGETPQCVQTCTNSRYATPFEQDKLFGMSTYWYHLDEKGVQAEIMRNGPVQTEYIVYEDFYNYKSGVYQHIDGQYAGRHSVKIIGWGVENGVPYWLIANSWGTSWGDLGGFFKILRGQDHCRVEFEVNAGQPRL